VTPNTERTGSPETPTTDYCDSDVAVIGYGGRFPGADSPQELWGNLLAGVDAIRTFSEAELLAHGVPARELSSPRYVRAAAVLNEPEGFDAAFFGVPPRDAELMDPQQRLFLESCWTALEHAGYDPGGMIDRVGVFAGSRTNTYLLHLARHDELVAAIGAFHLGLGNDLAFLPTRVSHAFNLTGPSCAVHTACSTSLVAVHLAVQSLLLGECRAAIAGGVAVNVPHVTGYVVEDGGVLSPDGRCRVFDAAARGTVFGSGVGVVVLKRLADAVADGDVVHAVIKGSAINNDGAQKASFTAPSVRGQTAVIEEAMRVAGVPARSITYVEAHGTGTLLGDAIELRALTKAYRRQTKDRGYCAIGSVKSNLGHLDAAAGVTGLIKVIESLRHELIPPSLHYETPNPQIDFEQSPFFVNTDVRPWPRTAEPRRAAVSAFGVGGTNVHVIVQEPPVHVPGEIAGGAPQLLVWSARTPEARDAAAHQLGEWLRAAPDAPLGDIAWTLQSGRHRLPWRRALVCQNARDAAESLLAGAADAEQGADRPDASGVVFAFPGQGAQYAGMGLELCESEPAYRDAFDRCVQVLCRDQSLDLRAALQDVSRLDETSVAQPALFATSYALAQLWASWGVRPTAMIGHSVGEYVAACLAGVLTLEDALQLVAARGRLMQAMPRGAMLAVGAEPAAIEPFLGDGVWLSAVNGSAACTLGGTAAAIDAVETRLRGAGHGTKRLQTSHAYHTPLMEEAAARFREVVAATPRQVPAVPYVSNPTGQWITDEEVMDPGYWARQLRQPVQFAACIATILADSDRFILEVGPGQGLTRLLRRAGATQVCASLPHAAGDAEMPVLLGAAGRLWTAGVELDWRAVHGARRPKRATLPTYAFERKRYWIDVPTSPRPTVRDRRSRIAKGTDVSRWFWGPSWKLARRVPRAPGARRAGEHWLIFADDEGLADAIVATLRATGANATIARKGREWICHSDASFTIDPGNVDHYRRLRDELAGVSHVLHLWGVASPGRDTRERVEALQADGLHSLIHVVRHFSGAPGLARRFTVVATDGTQVERADAVDGVNVAAAAAVAFCKVLSQETEVRTRFVDVSSSDLSLSREAVAERLVRELDGGDASDLVVAHRGRNRWIACYERLAIDASGPAAFPLRDRGVYLITGGLGAVAGIVARQLAAACRATVVLTGRRRPQTPPEVLRDVESLGGTARILEADVTSLVQMRGAIDHCYEEFGALHGIIHAAGVTSGPSLFRTIAETEPEHCRVQTLPKVHGLYTIEEALRGRPTDFVLAISSNAAVLGGLGFLSYAAANAMMDAFVASRAARGTATRWLSASWDHWPEETRKYHDVSTSMDEYAMTPDEAREAMRLVLTSCDAGQVIVATGDLGERLALWLEHEPDHAGVPAGAPTGAELGPRPVLRTPYATPRDETEARVAGIWAEFLGVSPVGVNDDFFELGGHSLMAIKMIAEISRALGVEVPLRALFEGPTVAQLVAAAGVGVAPPSPSAVDVVPPTSS
jgi:phthiocerol/phenolphthiocerol synthesis type-I polyketide synthase E